MKEACPITNYIPTTFHLDKCQCAHQSLSNTATPELGMISYRDKGTLANSYIAKDAIKLSQANTIGFHRLSSQANKQLDCMGY